MSLLCCRYSISNEKCQNLFNRRGKVFSWIRHFNLIKKLYEINRI
nr:MAG TPA: hypothetical protein [Caudoviricetes sp.]